MPSLLHIVASCALICACSSRICLLLSGSSDISLAKTDSVSVSLSPSSCGTDNCESLWRSAETLCSVSDCRWTVRAKLALDFSSSMRSRSQATLVGLFLGGSSAWLLLEALQLPSPASASPRSASSSGTGAARLAALPVCSGEEAVSSRAGLHGDGESSKLK